MVSEKGMDAIYAYSNNQLMQYKNKNKLPPDHVFVSKNLYEAITADQGLVHFPKHFVTLNGCDVIIVQDEDIIEYCKLDKFRREPDDES